MRLFFISLLISLIFPWSAYGADGDTSLYLWRLINEARERPLASIAAAGIEEEAAREAMGEWEWVLDEGLPPLAWNNDLFASASGHGLDMVENVYYACESPDGTTPGDRIAAAGYQALETGESLGILGFFNYIEPMDAAALIFGKMLADELDPQSPLPKNILNPYLTEVGISFETALIDLGAALPLNVYLVTADFGRPVRARAFLIGNLYYDPEGTKVWAPDRAAAGMDVALWVLAEKREIKGISGTFGEYQFSLRPDLDFLILEAILEARDSEGAVMARRSVFDHGVNQMVDLSIEY